MDIFGKKRINELEKIIESLKATIAELTKKLHQKQEVINETNAYWKKKIYAMKSRKKEL
jgi:prefoldin subunit 5